MNATLKLLVDSFGGERALARKSPICAGRYNSTKANDVRFFYMAFKTTHNKDESLPQFMKSPQLIFSHKKTLNPPTIR